MMQRLESLVRGLPLFRLDVHEKRKRLVAQALAHLSELHMAAIDWEAEIGRINTAVFHLQSLKTNVIHGAVTGAPPVTSLDERIASSRAAQENAKFELERIRIDIAYYNCISKQIGRNMGALDTGELADLDFQVEPHYE